MQKLRTTRQLTGSELTEILLRINPQPTYPVYDEKGEIIEYLIETLGLIVGTVDLKLKSTLNISFGNRASTGYLSGLLRQYHPDQIILEVSGDMLIPSTDEEDQSVTLAIAQGIIDTTPVDRFNQL